MTDEDAARGEIFNPRLSKADAAGRRRDRGPLRRRAPLKRELFLLETTHPGIFAAGDVRLGTIPRVASAVGEGAMAIKFVHEYLAGG